MIQRWRWGLFGAIFLAGSAAWGETSLEQGRTKLEKIQTEISRKKREKQETERRSRELAQEVERISKELESARRSLEQTEAKLKEAEARRQAAETRLWASRQTLGQWQERLADSMAHYQSRRQTAWEGTGVSLAYEQALVTDQILGLRFALEKHQDIVSLRDDLLAAEEQWRSAKWDKERDERRIESARTRMNDLKKTAEGRRALLDRELRALNASAERFERMVNDLIAREKAQAEEEAKKKAVARPVTPKTVESSAVSKRWKGKLPWPVMGSVVEKFGRTRHAELGADLFSNGVRLRPAADVSVSSVAPGEVIFAGPFMNYGLMVLVSHPDDLHSVYAHLGNLRVERGQRVKAGDPLGQSGRDDQGRPLVYFELRVHGSPVDPQAWAR